MKKLISIELVKNERVRQIKEEGYSWRHDDQETTHQLSDAAIVYATPAPVISLMNTLSPMAHHMA